MLLFIFSLPAQAAIEYGSSSYQAPFAATTTEKVGQALDQIVKGELGASSTSDIGGIVEGSKNIFTKIADWLKEKANIDLVGIFKSIGKFFVSIFKWIFSFILQKSISSGDSVI